MSNAVELAAGGPAAVTALHVVSSRPAVDRYARTGSEFLDLTGIRSQ